jgi:hypothetical protein
MIALKAMDHNKQVNTHWLPCRFYYGVLIHQHWCSDFSGWFYHLDKFKAVGHHEAFLKEDWLHLQFLPSLHPSDIQLVNIPSKRQLLSLFFSQSDCPCAFSMLLLNVFIWYFSIFITHQREIVGWNHLSYNWLLYFAVHKSLVLKLQVFWNFGGLVLENLSHLMLQNHGVAGHGVKIYK